MSHVTVWSSLEYWVFTPMSGLPADVAEVVASCVPHWEEISSDDRVAAVAKQIDADQELCAWFDATMHAAYWFSMPVVLPRNAASVLCQFDPLHKGEDPERTSNEKTGPKDFEALFHAFLSAKQADKKTRTLMEWIDVAKQVPGIRCHPWVEEYLQAGERLGVPLRSFPTKVAEAPPLAASHLQAIARDTAIPAERPAISDDEPVAVEKPRQHEADDAMAHPSPNPSLSFGTTTANGINELGGYRGAYGTTFM